MLHEKISNIVKAAAKEAHTKLNPYKGPVYIYYRPADGHTWGGIRAFGEWEKVEDYWQLVTGERVALNATEEQIFNWIYNFAGQLPLVAVTA